MNSAGESSVFRHFRLPIYLFLLSEYLSVAPEGMQTNDALHHEVALTHGPSLHILRKLSHFLSITSCSSYTKQRMMWYTKLRSWYFSESLSFKESCFWKSLLVLCLPVKCHMIFAIPDEQFFKVKAIHCK